MEVSNFDPFVVEFRNELSPDLCQEIINRFEADERTRPGVTGAGYNPDMKQSLDLHLSVMDEWKDIDKLLFDSLSTCLRQYQEYIIENYGSPLEINCDHGYQIQKTEPGGFYRLHNDSLVLDTNRERILTYIWYLNEPGEGQTHLAVPDKMITPETGKLLIFPATWTYWHQGLPPLNTKYIVTGWLAHFYPKNGEVPEQDWQKHEDS